ncbi:MAG: metal-dependent hydrolase [Nitrosomonas sp.]|nr:MAG: metal-dependent hydrolase [Nitrosomonas sp.]
MDLLTQGLLGAAMAQSSARRQEARIATGVGFFAGIAADADILIQSESDPLLNIEFHRHFTHSLFFVPLGALLIALLLWLFLRNRLSFLRLYLFALLGYCLSGVLDAFTSYGTHLLWPLSEERIAWNTISVIDPIFTLILLVACIVAFKKYANRAARIGLVLAACYMSFGWLQLQRAENVAQTLIADRGHRAETLLVKPTLGNLVLWRSIYQFEGRLYVDAVRVGLFSEPRIYPGESIAKFVFDRDMNGLPPTSVLAADIARFTRFSAGLVAILPQQPNVLIDVRYSNLPMTVTPLWGIEMNPAQPDQHAKYMLYRDSSRQTREQFITLLLGGHIPD